MRNNLGLNRSMGCLKDFSSQVETMKRRVLKQAGDGQQTCFYCPE